MDTYFKKQALTSLHEAGQLVQLEEVERLLKYFVTKTSRADSEDLEVKAAMERCIELFERDYSFQILDNQGASFSLNYPGKIVILENEKNSENASCPTYARNDMAGLRKLVTQASVGRCRTRFPCPVILFRGKHICRSATLAGIPEIILRKSGRYFSSGYYAGVTNPDEISDVYTEESTDENEGKSSNVPTTDSSIIKSLSLKQIYDTARENDVALLKHFNVKTIFDLMVEKRKLKYNFYVSSSEKLREEREFYKDFSIVSFPYPGCEFFKEFHDMNFDPINLVFNWKQPECDAMIYVPEFSPLADLCIDWDKHDQWDLITITRNYLRYILEYIQESDSGILIHCISGWDRTPLFISLVRLSLWADGAIHQDLNESEILYLTLAYDWMLFGHNLCTRLERDESIMLFCFQALRYIVSDDYAVQPFQRNRLISLTQKSIPENSDEEFEQVEEPMPHIIYQVPPRSPPSPLPEYNLDDFAMPSDVLDDGPSTSKMSRTSLPDLEVEQTMGNAQLPPPDQKWILVNSEGSRSCSEASRSPNAVPNRKTKLRAVRRFFYKMYFPIIGKKYIKYEKGTSFLNKFHL